jgi:hypothetical protein
MLSRAGLQNIDRHDIAALVLVCEWSSFDVNRMNRGSQVENHDRPVTSVDTLKSWLGCLGSYRYVQKKVQTYMLAIPRCFDSLHHMFQGQVAQRPHTTAGTPSGRRSRETKVFEDNGKVTLSVFMSALDGCNAPINHAEAMALGHLLVREKPRNAGKDRRTPKGDAHKKRLSMDDSSVSVSVSSSEENASSLVDVSLMNRIQDGNFISAAL